MVNTYDPVKKDTAIEITKARLPKTMEAVYATKVARLCFEAPTSRDDASDCCGVNSRSHNYSYGLRLGKDEDVLVIDDGHYHVSDAMLLFGLPRPVVGSPLPQALLIAGRAKKAANRIKAAGGNQGGVGVGVAAAGGNQAGAGNQGGLDAAADAGNQGEGGNNAGAAADAGNQGGLDAEMDVANDDVDTGGASESDDDDDDDYDPDGMDIDMDDAEDDDD